MSLETFIHSAARKNSEFNYSSKNNLSNISIQVSFGKSKGNLRPREEKRILVTKLKFLLQTASIAEAQNSENPFAVFRKAAAESTELEVLAGIPLACLVREVCITQTVSQGSTGSNLHSPDRRVSSFKAVLIEP